MVASMLTLMHKKYYFRNNLHDTTTIYKQTYKSSGRRQVADKTAHRNDNSQQKYLTNINVFVLAASLLTSGAAGRSTHRNADRKKTNGDEEKRNNENKKKIINK